MKIKEFIKERTQRLVALFVIVCSILLVANYFTNNLVIVGLGALDEKITVIQNDCITELDINDNVLTLKDFVFKRGFGKCVEELDDNAFNKVVIDNVFGGDVTETRILSKYIKKNHIPVIVKGRCDSSCMDIVLHSPQRMICYEGKIGIHAYSFNEETPDFLKFLLPIKQDAILRPFEDTNVDVAYIKDVMKKTPSNSIFYPDNSILVKKHIVHREIPCNSERITFKK